MSETKLTNQSAFTIAAKGLLAQGQMSGNSEEGCKYRSTREGQKLCCGIGFLVTDELAVVMDKGISHEIGIGGVNEVLPITSHETGIGDVIGITKVSEVLGHLDIMLLGDIQQVHDTDPVECWEKSLKKVAAEYNLKWEL